MQEVQVPARFIYINQAVINAAQNPMPSKVLINPHFKAKVLINPNFIPPPETSKKIHVNPKMIIKSVLSTTCQQKNTNNSLNIDSTENTSLPVKQNSILSANISKSSNISAISGSNKVSKTTTLNNKSRYKYTNPNYNSDNMNKRILLKNTISNLPKCSPFRCLPLINATKTSICTKYKLVRRITQSDKTSSPIIKKFKIDKRKIQSSFSETNKDIKRKFVYVNKFPPLNVLANNVILKQNNLKKYKYININGILYSNLKTVRRRTELKKKTNVPGKITRFKIIRQQEYLNKLFKPTGEYNKNERNCNKVASKLKKSNLVCQTYRISGNCMGLKNGRCIKVHNPDHIILCARFLQGACLKKKCPLSHKVSPEKMPTCKFYLEGLCSRDDCPYAHVKISPKSDICKDFIEGFCKEGIKCNKRHQFICPDFDKIGKCLKRRCPYPHVKILQKSRKSLKKYKTNHKQLSSTNEKENIKEQVYEQCVKNVHTDVEVSAESTSGITKKPQQSRYYENQSPCLDNSSEANEKTGIHPSRPKLGLLPSFIPLGNQT